MVRVLVGQNRGCCLPVLSAMLSAVYQEKSSDSEGDLPSDSLLIFSSFPREV